MSLLHVVSKLLKSCQELMRGVLFSQCACFICRTVQLFGSLAFGHRQRNHFNYPEPRCHVQQILEAFQQITFWSQKNPYFSALSQLIVDFSSEHETNLMNPKIRFRCVWGGACLLRIIPFQMCSNFCTGGFLTRCHHRWISGNWWTRSRCEAWNVRMIMLYSLVHIVLPVFDRNSLFVFPPFPWHIFSYGKDGHSIISAQNLWWSEVSRCNTPSIEKCFELGNHILSDRQRPWW